MTTSQRRKVMRHDHDRIREERQRRAGELRTERAQLCRDILALRLEMNAERDSCSHHRQMLGFFEDIGHLGDQQENIKAAQLHIDEAIERLAGLNDTLTTSLSRLAYINGRVRA